MTLLKVSDIFVFSLPTRIVVVISKRIKASVYPMPLCVVVMKSREAGQVR